MIKFDWHFAFVGAFEYIICLSKSKENAILGMKNSWKQMLLISYTNARKPIKANEIILFEIIIREWQTAVLLLHRFTDILVEWLDWIALAYEHEHKIYGKFNYKSRFSFCSKCCTISVHILHKKFFNFKFVFQCFIRQRIYLSYGLRNISTK